MFLTILQLLKYSTLLFYFTWEKGHKFYVNSFNFLEYLYLAKKKNLSLHFYFKVAIPTNMPFQQGRGLEIIFEQA